EATPLQLARAIGGIASGGVLRRPHTVFPDELTPEQLSAIHDSFPGAGDKTIPLTTANWQLITDDMAGVTSFGTAGEAHLEGIDFVGKTGTAQVMSHSALATTSKGHNTVPNAWFVGMAPRRNPDIVVAVLWEHGNWGNNSAKLAAQVIAAYVNKQRAKEGNLMKVAEKKPAAVEEQAAQQSDVQQQPTQRQPVQPAKREDAPAGAGQ
ncbi:MAG: penicillin-binding transpeptidase domain-containing protein, partial [Bryocella sp.]